MLINLHCSLPVIVLAVPQNTEICFLFSLGSDKRNRDFSLKIKKALLHVFRFIKMLHRYPWR